MVSQTQNLVLRQSQTLVMTQAMQQSLKILQLSTLDLANLIETELQNNPLLEAEGEVTERVTEEDHGGEEKDSFDNLNSNEKSEGALDNDSNDWNSAEDTHSGDEYSSDNVTDISSSYGEDDAGTIIEKTFSEEISLKEHLLEQVNVDFINPKNKIIAAHLVDMVDASGYLSSETFNEDIKQLAEKLGCAVEDIDAVIAKMQKFDPVGICARNLKECLKIQLNDRQTLDPALEKLVDNLEILAKGELDKLMKICGVSSEDLMEMIKEIKSLNPRPASDFSEDRVQTKHADLVLEKKNGKWHLELNYDLLPKIAVRKDYYNEIKANKLKGNDKKYLTENFNSANFLIRAVQQRCETMMKVGAAIVEHQEQFFDKGINYLKPISMKQIAEEVQLHESTIGRVVANKYMATPRGVYELRYFFTSGLGGKDNEAEVSSETARHQIKELIEGESKVLSDDELTTILKAKGIDIARRTVAKYRESMNIPTSAVRKRLKKISV